MKKAIYLTIMLIASISFAQTNEKPEADIDASKPTNFYSQLDNTFEVAASETQNVMGYRGKFMFAPSEAHLVLAEVPILYNDRTKKVGLGDIRARYFYLPYKNYDKFVGAFGPSVDVFAPTGSFKDGLGSGRFIVSPGLTVGLMASETIQFFPILSYQYSSKPTYDNPTPDADIALHGMSFQVITPIVFSEKFFTQITPIYKMNDINNERNDRFEQEIFAAYSLTPKLQLTGYYNGKFQDKTHTVSVGLTMFL
ncbi:hypothetical protein [Flavicella marina]|uniref:hypothetical protein n=1 Tax=Flavicella marina TaxID=1475951 RepID=UPI001264F141|nr:hypothetical protein [Flavicella marina]